MFSAPPTQDGVQEEHPHHNLHRRVEHHVQKVSRVNNVAQVGGDQVVDLSDEIAGAARPLVSGLVLRLGLSAARD